MTERFPTTIEGGGIEIRQLDRPDGLSDKMITDGIEIVEEWEAAHASCTELIIELYKLFNDRK